MKTEKAVRNVQIYGYPSSLVDAIRGKEGWSIVCVTLNPNHNQSYEVRYNDKKVITYGVLYGFGIGSQAAYPSLRESVIALLKTVIPNDIGRISYKNVFTGEDLTFDCPVYENDYTA